MNFELQIQFITMMQIAFGLNMFACGAASVVAMRRRAGVAILIILTAVNAAGLYYEIWLYRELMDLFEKIEASHGRT